MECHLKTQGLPRRETWRDEETLGKHDDHRKEKARRSEGKRVRFQQKTLFLQNNAGNWNTFAEKCQTLQTQVTTAQKQIDDVKKVGNMFSSPPLKFPHSAVRDQPSKGRP